MQDHEFEKQVHQKMEEIKILPSDTVWKEVERRLHPKNKSRRWIWFPFLLFGLGIGGYLMYTNNPASHKSLQTGRNLSLHNSNGIKLKDTTGYKKEVIKSKTTQYKNQDTIDIRALSILNSERHLSVKDKNLITSRQVTFPAPATHSANHANKTAKPEINSLLQNNSMNSNTRDDLVENTSVTTRHLHKTESLSSDLSGYRTDDSSGTMIITKEPVPARVNTLIAPANPVNTSLALRNLWVAVNAPARKQQKRSGWEWGFSVQAGQSDVTNGKFTSLFAREAVADVNNSFTTGNQSVNPSTTYISPSALKPGPGYSTGVLVKKQLTRRTSISAGLQYTRFTTSQKVGKRVTDTLIILRNSTADQKAIEEFFRLGNTDSFMNHSYMNKYHFIGLPVVFETKLTDNRFVPVYWDFGVSFSRLVSSNALHYDGNSKIYYKDNGLFNQNQLSIHTGLPVRIVSGNQFSFKAGPVVQYGISDMIKQEQRGSKHFLYVGLKADITFYK